MKLIDACLAAFTISSTFNTAHAEDFLRNINKPAVQSERKAVFQDVYLIGTEDRKDLDEFAAATESTPELIRQTFGASGSLHCGGRIGTAQLTGSSNVITTVAHVFTKENCKPQDWTTCRFRPLFSDSQSYEVDESSVTLGGCRAKMAYDMSMDWATAKLKEPVEGVTPYKIPNGTSMFTVGRKLLQASAGDTNFRNEIPNFQACSYGAINKYKEFPLQTNCDTGPGASGSAQLVLYNSLLPVSGTNLVIASVNAFEYTDGAAYGTEYSSESRFNASIPLAGDFLKAVIKLVAAEAIPLPRKMPSSAP